MSTAQTQAQIASKRRIKPTSLVYWLRVFMAILAGFANQSLHVNQASLGDFALFVGIGLGIVVYLFSVVIVRYGLHYGEAELKGKNRYITLGGGTFIILWIVVSVLLNTVSP